MAGEVRAEEPCTAGDQDPFVREIHGLTGISWKG